MNADNCTFEEYQELIASGDSEKRLHLLWVDLSGGVHLDPVPEEIGPKNYAKKLQSLKFCFQTIALADEVGPEAAKNTVGLKIQFDALCAHWADGTTGLFVSWGIPLEYY